MSKTIRQHYVPRTYLKHFSFDGKRLHTFLLNKDTPSVIGPENWGDYVKDISKGKAVFDVNFYQDEFSLFFPLTPNIILEYYNPSFFPDAIIMDKTISIVDSAYENQVNKYQYINAERFIFSPKNDFSLFLKPKH